MALIKVKKVTAIVLRKDTQQVLRKLQHLGVMEISKTPAGEEEGLRRQENSAAITRNENALQSVRYALSVITRYDHSKKTFLTPKPSITRRGLIGQKENMDNITAALNTANGIDSTMNSIRQRYSRIQNVINQLAPFRELDAPVEQMKSTEHAHMRAGYLPAESLAEADKLVEKYDGLLYIDKLAENVEFVPIFTVMHRGMFKEARADLKAIGFSVMHFDDFRGTIEKRLGKLQGDLDALEGEREEQEKRAEEVAETSKELLLAYEDYLINQLQSENAYANIGATDKVNVLSGYIRHYDEELLRSALEEVTDAYHLVADDPTEDDDVPTVVHNNKVVTPFESVTNMYSTPNYWEIDPNPVMSIFYFIFFGMMLSDAAYGILLSIGAMVVLKVKKPTGMFRNITTVLFICGFSTLIWGALFGSWMSIEGIPALMFAPLDEPMLMLGLCLGLGYLHIVVSVCVGFYVVARNSLMDAIFDKGFWLLVLLSVPMFILGMVGIAEVLSTVGLVMAVVGLVGLIATQGRHKKGIVKKLISGLGSVYDITGYLSDILSYCRIFGMALATGVIGMVFNTMVGMIIGDSLGIASILTIPVGALIFAVGHVFNLGINTLGSFVHTARLQYIESFGKFYEGGGRTFTPLAYRTKNFRIDDNDSTLSLENK